jgi:hypothetical protein
MRILPVHPAKKWIKNEELERKAFSKVLKFSFLLVVFLQSK